jgi:hypothetical protein
MYYTYISPISFWLSEEVQYKGTSLEIFYIEKFCILKEEFQFRIYIHSYDAIFSPLEESSRQAQ